jgi:hypothetical protein
VTGSHARPSRKLARASAESPLRDGQRQRSSGLGGGCSAGRRLGPRESDSCGQRGNNDKGRAIHGVRFRQRVAARSGALDPRLEIAGRVSQAWAAGRWSEQPPEGTGSRPLARGSVYVRDLVDRDLLFVCRRDRNGGELVVISLWEEGRISVPRVPRRYTDALR